MNRLGFALAILAAVATAAWAYNINYRTKTALSRVNDLRSQIATEREDVEVLRVEWAYLNAPERLARLVARHNDQLGLEPMTPQGFDDVAEIPFRPRPQEPGSDDAGPMKNFDVVLVVSERTALVVERVPMPAPRPIDWSLQ
ncbi:MAG TPA: cell division protein FtsL [Thermohalobaculum sp.]|nr:cell division protein FtsL [Thermohalobaculum sp.]